MAIILKELRLICLSFQSVTKPCRYLEALHLRGTANCGWRWFLGTISLNPLYLDFKSSYRAEILIWPHQHHVLAVPQVWSLSWPSPPTPTSGQPPAPPWSLFEHFRVQEIQDIDNQVSIIIWEDASRTEVFGSPDCWLWSFQLQVKAEPVPRCHVCLCVPINYSGSQRMIGLRFTSFH